MQHFSKAYFIYILQYHSHINIWRGAICGNLRFLRSTQPQIKPFVFLTMLSQTLRRQFAGQTAIFRHLSLRRSALPWKISGKTNHNVGASIARPHVTNPSAPPSPRRRPRAAVPAPPSLRRRPASPVCRTAERASGSFRQIAGEQCSPLHAHMPICASALLDPGPDVRWRPL